MAKFIYRMQNILNLQTKLENEAKIQLTMANNALRVEQEKLEKIYRDIEGYEDRIRSFNGGVLDVQELKRCNDAIAVKKIEAKEQKGRFIYLFSDDGFNYYLDSVSSCRTTPPSGSAKLLEVWIKLLPLGLAPETEVVIDQTYYLQHYMLWPDREQIMFLAELEVEGRPDNNIKERPFDGRNWEKLVPGSLEDNIYRECMKYRSSLKKRGPQKKTTSKIGDVLEDTFHISL